MKPLVTVLMPVYNGERFLPSALDSILTQTYRDFILLVIDDGSTDTTPDILAYYRRLDTRVRVIRRPRSGFLKSLNAGMEAVNTPYVARMDADDLCFPQRLEVQIQYLEQHPECVLVGCSYVEIDPNGNPLCVVRVPTSHEEIDAELLEGRCHVLTHPCVTFRTDAAREVGGYTMPDGEDLDLWLRLAEHGRIANLPYVLMCYRQHLQSISSTTKSRQVEAMRAAAVAARKRRGLPESWADDGTFVILSRPDQSAFWAYRAMAGKNFGTALKHAARAIRQEPWCLRYWRLAGAIVRHKLFDGGISESRASLAWLRQEIRGA